MKGIACIGFSVKVERIIVTMTIHGRFFFYCLLVNLERNTSETVCIGAAVVMTCDITVTGTLIWQDNNGNQESFTSASDSPGAMKTLGAVVLNLVQESGTTLMSTATMNNIQNDLVLTCSNGVRVATRSVNVAGEICLVT